MNEKKRLMNNTNYIFVLVGVCFIIVGCGANEEEKYTTTTENVNQVVIEEQTKNDDVMQEHNEDDLSAKLGEVKESDKQVSDDRQEEKTINDCDEGFIYHTELEECFKVGDVIDSEHDKVEIDPIVQECIDKGGIYNAQAEKCFINK